MVVKCKHTQTETAGNIIKLSQWESHRWLNRNQLSWSAFRTVTNCYGRQCISKMCFCCADAVGCSSVSAKRGTWLKAAISLKRGPALLALSWSDDITYHWWAHASLHRDTWLLFPNHMSYCWVSSNHTELWVDMPEQSWHREDADISVVDSK